MNVEKIREEFPFLKRKIKGKPIVYMDNTATSQRPQCVINSLKDFYENHNANIHRGVHQLSQEASEMYENAHDKTSKFINARGREEIIFTKNTTESINLVANSLDWKAGDEVIVSEMEHHSNIVPWQVLEQEKGIKLKFAPVNSETGEIELDKLNELITPKTKLISTVHISNFLGTVNPVEQIGKIAKENDALFMVDAAQSAPHLPLDVKKINCDFMAFSSHKMLGPTGIGVLYGKKEILQDMKPFLSGGDMILDVDFDGYKPNVLPWKFEAGTANIADGYAFGVALDYLNKLGMKNVWNHDQELIKYTLDKVKDLNLEIYGPKDAAKRGGLLAFNVPGMEPHDVAGMLNDQNNIMVRSGHHCVMPMHKKLKANGSVRAPYYVYNTIEEMDLLVENLKNIIEVFGK